MRRTTILAAVATGLLSLGALVALVKVPIADARPTPGPITGGGPAGIAGQPIVPSTVTTGMLSITGAAATARQQNFQTNGVNRWIFRANNTAESGANAGSDMEFVSRADDGSVLYVPITMVRATGKTKFDRGTVHKGSTAVYSTSMTADAAAADHFTVTATDGVAFTINSPLNPNTDQEITITIRNASGGALGVATWNSVFKMATWTQPASGFSRAIQFIFDGSNWVEKFRTPVDVPT